MKKRFLIAALLLLILSTYTSNDNLNFNSKFNIKKIVLENNDILNEDELKKELSFLYDKNLFFLKNRSIKDQLRQNTLIKSFNIKKIYPNTIKIKIFEKRPIMILQNKREKFYFTEDGDIIKFVSLKRFNNLPIVYGDKENFKNFYAHLKKLNFPINEIKSFYFFESKRWDLITIKDKIVKLPKENYVESIKNFLDIKEKANFKKYKSFDYRIKNQLILK